MCVDGNGMDEEPMQETKKHFRSIRYMDDVLTLTARSATFDEARSVQDRLPQSIPQIGMLLGSAAFGGRRRRDFPRNILRPQTKRRRCNRTVRSPVSSYGDTKWGRLATDRQRPTTVVSVRLLRGLDRRKAVYEEQAKGGLYDVKVTKGTLVRLST